MKDVNGKQDELDDRVAVGHRTNWQACRSCDCGDFLDKCVDFTFAYDDVDEVVFVELQSKLLKWPEFFFTTVHFHVQAHVLKNVGQTVADLRQRFLRQFTECGTFLLLGKLRCDFTAFAVDLHEPFHFILVL